MNRRQLLKGFAALPVLPASAHQHAQPAAAKPGRTLKFFTPAQNEFVTTLVELIIPQTTTPGARTAGVNYYMDQVLAAADAGARRSFLEGLAWLDARAQKVHARPFLKLTPEQQYALLEPLATGRNMIEDDEPGVRFFERVKSLTITGYYTSPEGFINELGFTNGFTGDYPGCTHPEHK